MRLSLLIPRTAVRLKNEILLALRYGSDPRFRRLASSYVACGYVTYAVSAGLANRLRAHYLACVLARASGRTVVPIWLPTKELASDGNDVFPQAFIAEGELPIQARLVRVSNLQELPRVLRESIGHLLVLDFDAQWQSIEASRRSMNVTEPIVFAVRDKIVADAGAIRSQLTHGYISVHVRQGDFLTHTGFAKPLDYFEDQIIATRKCFPAAESLLVASDEPLSLSPAIAGLFAKTVVLTPRYKRTEQGVAPEALSHLVALANATEFIPSPMSSFSELVLAMRSSLVRVEGQRHSPATLT
jgi:hypothetical protein